MLLKPMDPEVIHKLLEGTKDVLTPQVKLDQDFYKNVRCPVCGHKGCEKRIFTPKIVVDNEGNMEFIRSPFGDDMLPEGYAFCMHCSTSFDPYTSVIIKTEASVIAEPGSDPHLT